MQHHKQRELFNKVAKYIKKSPILSTWEKYNFEQLPEIEEILREVSISEL